MQRLPRLAALALVIGPLMGCATPQPSMPQPGTEQATLPPDVADAMRDVSNTLASARALTVNMSMLREGILADQQSILLGATSTLVLRRPDRLATVVGSDLGNFSLWYDGAKVTAFNPKENVFTTTPLQGDIDTAIRWVEKRLDIEIAIRPLLLADPYAAMLSVGTTGVYVGPTFVRGAPVHHYAMRSPTVEWEIWVSAQGPKVPRRLSVVDKTSPSRARVIIEFDNWNLAPRLTDAHFTFRPPSGAIQATPVLQPE